MTAQLPTPPAPPDGEPRKPRDPDRAERSKVSEVEDPQIAEDAETGFRGNTDEPRVDEGGQLKKRRGRVDLLH